MPQMKTETNIKLPFSFILYGLVALVLSQVILFISNDALVAGQFRIPDIWMGAHFLLLGWAVMIVMGAMYQLVPVAFLTPIWNETFGFIQFGVTAVGITAFSILLGFKPDSAIYGGMLAILGVLMFLFQMLKTILSQQTKNTMTYFVVGALVSFFITIGFGFLLAWNLAYGGIASHNTILYSHIVMGVAGWFTLLIFGFSYKLVPMFSLSHGFSMKFAKPAFFSYIAGLLVLISGFWLVASFIQTIGWLVLLVGFSLFVLDIKEILTKRLKKKLDKPFTFALLAIANGLVIHVLAFLLSLFNNANAKLWSWLIFLYVMTWIIFSILGYLNKIVPFLWWTHKYSDKVGKTKVPMLKEMINEKLSVTIFVLFVISVVGLTIGALAEVALLVMLFQALLTIASIAYVISIVRILFM
ncbi:hypothetical protein [Oceanobacillus halotolerans]|uniref:hypothetical protein n=1 Tax=Oceanobacillus halotolerans TaxID=2663380 RepID=UPI001CF7D0B9|nr:hypothetical protein [Oceanobacillus halotolerans]